MTARRFPRPWSVEETAACFVVIDGAGQGSAYRSGRSAHWVKVKNPKAPAVTREAEEDWGR
jgi:hypothetical protein